MPGMRIVVPRQPEEDSMKDRITNILADTFDLFNVNIEPADFEYYLEENGFMIVPIEDPTNLFGEDDG